MPAMQAWPHGTGGATARIFQLLPDGLRFIMTGTLTVRLRDSSGLGSPVRNRSVARMNRYREPQSCKPEKLACFFCPVRPSRLLDQFFHVHSPARAASSLLLRTNLRIQSP